MLIDRFGPLIDRFGPVLDKLGLLPLAFRAYQRASALTSGLRRTNNAPESDGGLPLPPPHLRMMVAGSTDCDVFLDGGRRGFETVQSIVKKNAPDVKLHDVMDFGCGCGRVLRHWNSSPTRIHGTDFNSELTDWCAQNLPFANFAVNKLEPPTGYPESQFDLIYAFSVFTHLPEDAQLAWMREFHRILRPAGLLLISLHGEYYLPRLNEAERRRFLEGQPVTRYGSSAGSNLCSVFHPESWVHANLAHDFEILDFVPEGALGNPRQDAWLFRRSDKIYSDKI